MNYWLMKSEPESFSIADLKSRPKKTEHWDGVRNYQARNFMRAMKKGDLVFFYHSSCPVPGVYGIIEVVRAVSFSKAMNGRIRSRRRMSTTMNAPEDPIPAASVGVKTPI